MALSVGGGDVVILECKLDGSANDLNACSIRKHVLIRCATHFNHVVVQGRLFPAITAGSFRHWLKCGTFLLGYGYNIVKMLVKLVGISG